MSFDFVIVKNDDTEKDLCDTYKNNNNNNTNLCPFHSFFVSCKNLKKQRDDGKRRGRST